MSNTKREPLLSDDGITKMVPEEADFYDCELTASRVREVYEADRTKDAELIQHLVDGVIGIYWMGPDASKKLMIELLATAAAAGYKPSDSTN
jgi:hypothetical protein